MKTTLKIFLFLVVALGFSATSMAQGTATASANIMKPITVTSTTNMNFGNVISSGTIGTLVLDPDDNERHPGGGVTIAASNAGTVSAAIFVLGGENSATFSINIPSATVSLTGPGTAMTVTNFLIDGGSTGNMSASGVATVKIGATLNVGANQTVGSYTSTGFAVNFVYN